MISQSLSLENKWGSANDHVSNANKTILASFMPTKPVGHWSKSREETPLKSFWFFFYTNGVAMLTTYGDKIPSLVAIAGIHPHEALTAGASASDPFGISAAAHSHIITMLKTSSMLITMQIPLSLFFHLINIVGNAFLWVQNYVDQDQELIHMLCYNYNVSKQPAKEHCGMETSKL